MNAKNQILNQVTALRNEGYRKDYINDLIIKKCGYLHESVVKYWEEVEVKFQQSRKENAERRAARKAV